MKAKSKNSEEIRWATQLVRERMKDSQAITHLGFDVHSVEKGRAVFQLDVLAHHKQIHGVVHGGILAALADTTADARVLRAGRNFVVTECEIFNEDGSLAEKAMLTFGAAAGHSQHE